MVCARNNRFPSAEDTQQDALRCSPLPGEPPMHPEGPEHIGCHPGCNWHTTQPAPHPSGFEESPGSLCHADSKLVSMLNIT